MIDHGTIDAKSGGCSLLDHPQQRKFRKATFYFRIAAAHICMHASEPDLTDILIDRRRWIEDIRAIFLRLDPAIEPKHPTALVD
jgi:hypothetical protein